MQDGDTIAIYATTLSRVGCYTFKRGSIRTVDFVMMDEMHGCELHCSCLDTHNHLVA